MVDCFESSDSKWRTSKNIPDVSGVYALYFNLNNIYVLQYIGSSKNLYKRIKTHPLLKSNPDVLIKYKPVDDWWDRYRVVERVFIERLKPILNIMFVKPTKYSLLIEAKTNG